MWDFLDTLFSPDRYMPHGNCYLWETPLVWLHVTSDVLIAIAYFSIPAMLLYFVFRRRDAPFLSVFVLFGAFIVLCGVGHLFDVWTLWHPAYWLSGIERAATALVSCTTAAAMVTLLPRFLSLKTPEQLEAVNEELQRQIRQREKTERALQNIIAGTAAVTGEDFFPALAQHLGQALEVPYVLISEAVGDPPERLRTLAVWADGKPGDPCEYALVGTPCEVVVGDTTLCHYPRDLQTLFPDAPLLAPLSIESYLGAPLLDASGRVLGNLCIMDTRPYSADDETKGAIEVFATRAAAELERQHTSEALTQVNKALAEMNVELEARVDERTAELRSANATLEAEVNFRKTAESLLRDREERLRKQQAALLELARNPSWYDGQLEAALEQLTECAAATLEVARASVWLYTGDREAIVCRDLYDRNAEGHNYDLRLERDDFPVYFHALDSEKIIDADDVLKDERTLEFRDAYSLPLNIASMMDVPIRRQGQTVGVICIEQVGETRHWTLEEQNFARHLGYMMALALEARDRAAAETALRSSEEKERTKADKLARTVKLLKVTQAQLVQNEKMASLGQLVAGVAHELNNPLSFIYGNLTYAEEYAGDLFGAIACYRENCRDLPAAAEREIAAADLDYVERDFPRLLRSMKEGADRVKQIVESLRQFASLDEADYKEADLNACLDSTLTVLQGRLNQSGKPIALVKEFSPLPKVSCYPGQLNQVFLNLLDNAIDAIEGRLETEPDLTPEIHATTRPASRDGRTGIEICLADNGAGLPDGDRERLFDPFFTTKPVGQGTGMGLSVAYQIVVERHGGRIEARSRPEGGTAFVLFVPNQPQGQSERTAAAPGASRA